MRALTVFRLVALAIAGASSLPLTGAGVAHAWVQGRTKANAPTRWPQHTVELEAATTNPPQFLAPGTLLQAATEAAKAWSTREIGCSAIQVNIRERAGAADSACDDRNVVRFVQRSWTYEPRALAITLVLSRISDGAIIDTDVELNAVNFTWTDLVQTPLRPVSNAADLQNTLTHEFGHVLGLDHNCTSPTQPNLIDHTGKIAPACATAPPELLEATMFPSVHLEDVSRRTLAADDLNAMCTIYPAGGPPTGPRLRCPRADDEGGCAVAARKPTPRLHLLLVLGLGLALCRMALRARCTP